METPGPPIRRPTPPKFANSNAAIRWAINDVTGLNHERLHVIDPNGCVLHSLDGERSAISIPDDVLRDLKGRISLHNHPEDDMSFSPDDIAVGLRSGEKESRVISARYHFRMRYLQKSPADVEPLIRQIDIALNIALQSEVNRIYDDVVSGQISEAEASEMISHRAWRGVAKKFGLFYERHLRR